MARACTVCQHPAREDIDRALVAAGPLQRLAAEFGLSRHALYRHKHAHIPAALAKAQEAKDLLQSDDLFAQVRWLHRKALQILQQAETARDYRTALLGIREARGCLELLAELEQLLDRRPVVNILLSPEWIKIRAVLMDALEPYPEVRAVVATRLWELTDGTNAADEDIS